MRRSSQAERQWHIETWRASGLSRPDYCKEAGLKYATFMSWFKQEAKAAQESGQFLELSSAALTLPIAQAETEIVFANGIRMIYRGSLNPELIQLLRDA